ncbi:MAG: hypothetical protein NBV67_14460 [Tagaea sp.]|nr:hypothetical protein [Tagaea sp.]
MTVQTDDQLTINELRTLKLIMAVIDYSNSVRFELQRTQINVVALAKLFGASDMTSIIENERKNFDEEADRKHKEILTRLAELIDGAE